MDIGRVAALNGACIAAAGVIIGMAWCWLSWVYCPGVSEICKEINQKCIKRPPKIKKPFGIIKELCKLSRWIKTLLKPTQASVERHRNRLLAGVHPVEISSSLFVNEMVRGINWQNVGITLTIVQFSLSNLLKKYFAFICVNFISVGTEILNPFLPSSSWG